MAGRAEGQLMDRDPVPWYASLNKDGSARHLWASTV